MEKIINYLPLSLLSVFVLKLIFFGTNAAEMGIVFALTAYSALKDYSEKHKKIQELGANRKHPDLVIEVVVSSGGIDKLVAYKRVQIPEVWIWMNDELLFYSLGNDGYEAVSKSPLLPSLDVGLLMRCINTENHAQTHQSR